MIFVKILYAFSFTFAAAAQKCTLYLTDQFQSAESCRSCHVKQVEQWEKSRHHIAFTNSIFQKGFSSEPHPRCLDCHLKGPVYNWDNFRDMVNRTIDKRKNEGVACVTCHTRDNQNNLKSSNLCAQCHQFRFENHREFAQNTFSEWQNFIKNNGKKNCQSCHMPKGDHNFYGPHNSQHLTSLKFKVLEKENMLQISNLHAGHNVPTGDVFRHITVEEKKPNGEWKKVETIGRNPYFQILNADSKLVFKNNNSLKPGEIRKIPLNFGKQIRVTYFYEAPWAGKEYLGGNLERKIIFEYSKFTNFR